MKRAWLIGISAFLLVLAFGFWRTQKEQSWKRLPVLSIRKDAQGGYTFLVDGKPYWVKGVCYLPIPRCQTFDYNFWAHPEIWKTDGRLMREMGVNTVRFYRDGPNPGEVKNVIQGLYRDYGIRSFMGHDLGFWDWPPANYGDSAFQARIKQEVLSMVERYKTEPGIIGWILGNENNYSFEVMNIRTWTTEEIEAIPDAAERMKAKARIYYRFVNDIAQAVKKIDPIRPIIMGVGEVMSLEIAAPLCPDIDLLGLIVYRGPGFGNLFSQVKKRFDKPVLLIEWGADSFHAVKQEEVQDIQAQYLQAQWRDIERNRAGKRGIGNCIGGTLFEWHDEWWKANETSASSWCVQDKTGQYTNASYAYDYDEPGRLNMNEEWYGIVSLKPKEAYQKTDVRVPKKACWVLRSLWRTESR